MLVREILAVKGSEVVTVSPVMPVSAAAKIMADRYIGAVVVIRDGSSVDGLVRESEIVRTVARRGSSLDDIPVSDVMVRTMQVCHPTDEVRAVMAQMTRHKSRHVPVVEDGRLCGLLSVGDLVKSRLDEMELESRVLREAYQARV
jgi:CBS domain-containing protein